jgi:hypothetical protein
VSRDLQRAFYRQVQVSKYEDFDDSKTRTKFKRGDLIPTEFGGPKR